MCPSVGRLSARVSSCRLHLELVKVLSHLKESVRGVKLVVKKRPGVRRGRVLGVGGPRVFQHRGGGGAEYGGEVTRPVPAPGLDIAGLGRLLLLAEGEWVVVLGPGLVVEAARLRGAEATLAWPRCRARDLVLLQLRLLLLLLFLLMLLVLLLLMLQLVLLLLMQLAVLLLLMLLLLHLGKV